MLFVIGTEAAVEGAAVLGMGLGRQRPVAGLQPVSLGLPVSNVVADQRLLDAMLAASLQIEDVRRFGDDLRRDQGKAGFTQARGLA